jgi:hypothetical protein
MVRQSTGKSLESIESSVSSHSTSNETFCVAYEEALEFIISDRVLRLFFESRTERPIIK